MKQVEITEEHRYIAAEMILTAFADYGIDSDLTLIQMAKRGLGMVAAAFDINFTYTMKDEIEVMAFIESGLASPKRHR